MSKIVLIDFDEKDREQLRAEGFDAELLAAGPGEPARPGVPSDLETLFFQMGRPGHEGRARNGLASDIAPLVEGGARVVCFVGEGDLVDLTGIIGLYPELHFRNADPSEGIVLRPKVPFSLIFDRFGPSIVHAYKLFQDPVPEASWDKASSVNGNYEFLAKGRDGRPVSVLIRKGKGFYLLLPSFGPKNAEVAGFFLKDVAPLLDLKATETPEYGWLDGGEYTFPALKDLLARREEEVRRHERALREIEDSLKDSRATEQESFNRLLKSEGPELRKAVVQALQYLGWGKVVDVDEYWKKVIRSKEEDVWLIEAGDAHVEASLQREPLILVLVRGGRNWATDDECALLQKYKGRRMQEFDNTKMKAVLIGNYYLAQEAGARTNPFSPVQVEEAQKDGNGLITTYELFKAVKAEKEGKVRKEDIRGQFVVKTGLVRFEW
ncbi:MAG TPA: hypothetical protein VHP61_03535 [Acidobacteriota bacterium]|nr:hypothetical protein [Acidobacteriota bacterium]